MDKVLIHGELRGVDQARRQIVDVLIPDAGKKAGVSAGSKLDTQVSPRRTTMSAHLCRKLRQTSGVLFGALTERRSALQRIEFL